MKDKILEIVRNNLDNEKLLDLIDNDVRETAWNVLNASEDEGGFNEDGEIFYETEGCMYDNVVDNLNFSEIANDEDDGEVINKLIDILKHDYDLENFEILETFDKTGITLEEGIMEVYGQKNKELFEENRECLDYGLEINEYNGFYPTKNGLVSLKGSDRHMTIIKKVFNK